MNLRRILRKESSLSVMPPSTFGNARLVASGAWKMYTDRGKALKAVRPLQHLQHAHSYRHELETFYYGLHEANRILQQPHNITQLMDCKGGLEKLDQRIVHPSQTMASDMDIVMAYQQLERQINHQVTRQWVMGHADEKKKDKPESITDLEWDNVSCNRAANEVIESGEHPRSFHPLPGYRAMLKLDGEWVTTHFHDCVEFAHNAPAMKAYVMRRLDIDSRTFDDIDWKSIGRVRATHQNHRRIRTSKMKLVIIGDNAIYHLINAHAAEQIMRCLNIYLSVKMSNSPQSGKASSHCFKQSAMKDKYQSTLSMLKISHF